MGKLAFLSKSDKMNNVNGMSQKYREAWQMAIVSAEKNLSKQLVTTVMQLVDLTLQTTLSDLQAILRSRSLCSSFIQNFNESR